MTDGFGLFPTIINPPYTTLTAYDLNNGVDSLADRTGRRSASGRPGHHRHRLCVDYEGRHHPDGRRSRIRHGGRSESPRVRQSRAANSCGKPSSVGYCRIAVDVRNRRHDKCLLVTATPPATPTTPAANPLPASPPGPIGIVAFALPKIKKDKFEYQVRRFGSVRDSEPTNPRIPAEPSNPTSRLPRPSSPFRR